MVVRRVGEFRRWFRSAGNDTSIPQPEATPTRLVYTTPKASKAADDWPSASRKTHRAW